MAASPPFSWSSSALSASRSAFDFNSSYSRVKLAASGLSLFPSISARPFNPTCSAVSILLVQLVRSIRRWQCCRVCSSSADMPTAVSLIAVTCEGMSSVSRTSLTLSKAAIHDDMREMRFSACFSVFIMFRRSLRSGSESAYDCRSRIMASRRMLSFFSFCFWYFTNALPSKSFCLAINSSMSALCSSIFFR